MKGPVNKKQGTSTKDLPEVKAAELFQKFRSGGNAQKIWQVAASLGHDNWTINRPSQLETIGNQSIQRHEEDWRLFEAEK